MSNAAVTWALQQRVSTSSAKFVLVVLANVVRDKPHVSGATGKTWPENHAYLSIASICQATGQDKKTVMAGLARLVSEGLIARAGTDGQTNQVGVFQLLMTSTKNGTAAIPKTGTGTSAKNGTGAESGTVPFFPDTGTGFSSHQYQISPSPVPKTGDEPVLNPVEPNKKPSGADAPPVASLTEGELWKAAAMLMAQAGTSESQARGYLGLLAKDHGQETLSNAIRATIVANPVDPKAYIRAACREHKPGRRANAGTSIEATWKDAGHVVAL